MPVEPVLVHVGVVWDHGVCGLDVGVVVQPVRDFISSDYYSCSLRGKRGGRGAVLT